MTLSHRGQEVKDEEFENEQNRDEDAFVRTTVAQLMGRSTPLTSCEDVGYMCAVLS